MISSITFPFFSSILLISVKGGIDKVQNRYLEESQITCGKPLENQGEPRIINGRESSNVIYPWLARVFKYIGSGDNYKSGGTIIGKSSILTCGHCVCRHKFPYTCRSDDELGPVNQNVKEVNEIYYTVGSKEFDDTYDDNIKVYLYNFEPNDMNNMRYFSANGDLAVVIDLRGLGLSTHKAVPILSLIHI